MEKHMGRVMLMMMRMIMMIIMMVMMMMMITYGEAHGVGHIGAIATVKILLLDLDIQKLHYILHQLHSDLFNLYCNKDTSSISAVRVISWSVNCPQAT